MCTSAARNVRGPHHRADVAVVFPVLDRNVERMPTGVEVSDDRLDRPVAVDVEHIAAITLGQQHRIEAWVVGPRVGMRSDADGRLGLAHDARRAPASQRSLPPGIVWTCSVQSEPFQ